jgi:hypothetical protein
MTEMENIYQKLVEGDSTPLLDFDEGDGGIETTQISPELIVELVQYHAIYPDSWEGEWIKANVLKRYSATCVNQTLAVLKLIYNSGYERGYDDNM